MTVARKHNNSTEKIEQITKNSTEVHANFLKNFSYLVTNNTLGNLQPNTVWQ